ncbi:MAG: DUF3656 domain-containing protein [Pirellulales bacterium]
MRPELLAPAGSRSCVKAAIENGADAIYFGLEVGFNARARAENLTVEELPELMAQLHERDVRGYVTLNTLVFTDELHRFEQHVRQVAEAGADAVLIQDFGAARLVREICPELPIHASTQMTLTCAESIRVAEQLGLQRVVLARELSLDEIARIRAQTQLPLEVFVHGALCVAYSGQCLTSESLGGRSANRGQCAQACRLPYELIADGRDVDLGSQQYLLSPQDLAAYELVPRMVELGISSLKIEGRLKTPEYVANVTQHYRAAIDHAVAGQAVTWDTETRQRVEMSFSRGLAPGWLEGCDHKRLVPGESSTKRGVYVGQIERMGRGRVTVRLNARLQRGDGVVFDGDRTAGTEQGGRIYGLRLRGADVEGASPGDEVEIELQRGRLDFAQLHIGQRLWKTDDPQLTRELRATFSSPHPVRRAALTINVSAHAGQPLHLVATDPAGRRVELTTDAPLEVARKHPLTAEVLREQFGRLGNSPYTLQQLTAQIAGEPMAPLSVLGGLRHELVRRMTELRQQQVRSLSPPDARTRLLGGHDLPEKARRAVDDSSARASDRSAESATSQLHVLCRWPAQLPHVLAARPDSIYVDFADIREYRAAAELSAEQGVPLWIATPRIFKPGEQGILKLIERAPAAGIVARNLAAVDYFVSRNRSVIADFSLNAANELTVQWLLSLGVDRVTASYDLNRDQLLELINACPSWPIEVVVHQHMPMFHMEHCVFCAVLSPGTNKTNCGRPCDDHRVELRDRVGMQHPLHADVGCRNTLYNQVAQSAAEIVPVLRERRVNHFRAELLDQQSADEIAELVRLYRELLAGHRSPREVWQQLHAMNRVGVTRGSLEERRNPLAIL